MHEGFRFYCGDPWSTADLEKPQQEKRPALTINLVLPIINLLSGIQRQGRQDIMVVARKGGYEKLASIYTHLLRQCLISQMPTLRRRTAFSTGLAAAGDRSQR